jgi:murein L,D-transpeptidase YafK
MRMWCRIAASVLVFLSAAAAPAADSFVGNEAPRVVRIEVRKAARLLLLLDRDGSELRRYTVALGGDPQGDKRREGDSRTPEGRYVVDWRNPDSAYHLSLHVSYPDERDRAEAAARGEDPGGMIMIHGMRNGFGWLGTLHQYVDWTDGCIAVTNDEIEEIWRLVPNGTPIDILP